MFGRNVVLWSMLCLQARSDWFVYVVLAALPWVGQELHQKKEKDLDNLLSQIGAYIQLIYFSTCIH